MFNRKTILTIVTILALWVVAGAEGSKQERVNALQEIDTTKLERYERKVLIDAKWGSGPGEFGVIKEAGGIAPNCYTIDKNGNIYIPDPVNARVQIFSSNGKYLKEFQYTEKNERSRHLSWEPYDIKVDDNQNVYILFYICVGSFPGQSVEVRKYNSAGEFVDRFLIPLELLGPTIKEIEMGMTPLLIRERITKIVIENSDIKVEGWFSPEYLGKEKGERRRYTLFKDNHALRTQEVLKTIEVITSNKQEKINFLHLGYWGYADTTGNFFYFFDHEKIGEKDGWGIHQGIIYKYNTKGELIAILKHPFYKWGDLKQLYFDDKAQDIYCLTNDDEGVKLLLFKRF